MEVLDTLTTENGRVLTAVKVLDALLVLLAHVWRKISLVSLVVLVHVRIGLQALLEVDSREKGVSRHHFVEDVEVEGQLVHRIDSFQKFAAHRTPYSIVSEEVGETRSAESMAAADYYARYALSHVKF